MYPDNSVVIVLFRSQATAITSNLLLFHETTSSGPRQWSVSVFFNLHCIGFIYIVLEKLRQNEQFMDHLIFNIVPLPTTDKYYLILFKLMYEINVLDIWMSKILAYLFPICFYMEI